MDNNHYRIIFKGEILPGKTSDEVKHQISQKFKLNQNTLEKLFSGRPVLIKKKVDYNTALKYKKIFQDAGAKLYFKKIKSSLSNSSQKTIKKTEQSQAQSSNHDPWNYMSEQNTWNKTRPSISRQQQTVPITPEKKSHLPPSNGSYAFNPPKSNFSEFSIGSLIVQNILCNVLLFTIIGIFFAPQIYYNYLIGHMHINKKQLQFSGNFILFATVAAFFIFSTLFFLPFYPLFKYFINNVLEIALFLQPLITFFVIIISAGCALVVHIQSLLKNTFIEGKPACTHLYPAGIEGLIKYIINNYKKIFLWGLGACIGFFIPPVLLNIIFKEWFTHIKIDGYQYRLDNIWEDTVSDSILFIVTLGIYNLFYMQKMFNHKLPSGYWEKVDLNI